MDIVVGAQKIVSLLGIWNIAPCSNCDIVEKEASRHTYGEFHQRTIGTVDGHGRLYGSVHGNASVLVDMGQG